MKHFINVLSVWIAIGTSTHAVVTSDAPGTHVVSQMDDTFGVNLDGVALIGGIIPEEGLPRGFCGGALITDRHVVTAAHCFDTNGDSILDPDLFIFPSEILFEIDGDWTVIDYDPAKVKWSWEEHGSDIAVVILEEDAPGYIPRYALYGGRAEVGQPFVVVGYGWAGFGPTGFDSDFDTVRTKRAGLNRFDALVTRDGAQFLMSDFDSGQPEHNSLGDLGFGPDEVSTTQLDSGSPGFLDGAVAGVVAFGGQLALVDATDGPDDSWGEREYRTRVSSVRDYIMAATDGQAVFVVPGDPAVLGDYDNDQVLTAADIDILSRATRLGIYHFSFDLNDDDAVTQLDREIWTQELAGTFLGDADLNHAVEFADFAVLAEGFGRPGGWGDGDFDGDGVVQFPDFALLADNFGKSAIGPVLAEIPEPSSCFLALIGVALIGAGIGRRKHFFSAVVIGCVILSICGSSQAIVTSDGPGTHVVSQMEDTYGINLDGVALIGGFLPSGPDGFCSGALITDHHVLTAASCFDVNRDLMIDPELFEGPSEVLLESAGNWTILDYDPAKVLWSEDWVTSRYGIAIVTLEENPPSDLPRYALYGGNAEVGQPFVLVGYGLTGFGPTGIDPEFDPMPTKRAGLNQYDVLDVRALDVADARFLVSDFDSGQAQHNSLVDRGFGADEVAAAPYDSGGPGYLDGAIASVVAFGQWLPEVDATTEPDGSWGEQFLSNRVSADRDFILTATNGEAVIVMKADPAVPGDFDHDHQLAASDIDILSRAIRFGIDHASFDLNHDDDVNQLDRVTWIQELVGTFLGDANLNRTVEFDDFVLLANQYGGAGGWGTGDFDGSGDVDFGDFVILADNYGKSAAALAPVPEPSGCALVLVATGVLLLCRCRKTRTTTTTKTSPRNIPQPSGARPTSTGIAEQ